MGLPRARVLDGKKYMWDQREYESAEEAEKARTEYEGQGFDARIEEEDGKVRVFTRRVVKDVKVEGPAPT